MAEQVDRPDSCLKRLSCQGGPTNDARPDWITAGLVSRGAGLGGADVALWALGQRTRMGAGLRVAAACSWAGLLDMWVYLYNSDGQSYLVGISSAARRPAGDGVDGCAVCGQTDRAGGDLGRGLAGRGVGAGGRHRGDAD